MNIRNTLITILAVASLILSATANATLVSFNVSGAFTSATGSLSSLLGQSYASSFSYDTNTSLAHPGSLAFSTANGQALGAAYDTPYTVTPSINGSQLYTGGSTIVEIDHNMYISSVQNHGIFPAGTYDIFGVNGHSPGSTCSYPCTTISGDGSPGSYGSNFEVDFFGNFFTSDLTIATQMPSLHPAKVSFALVHYDKWENGVKTGSAYQIGQISVSPNNISIVSAVPVPAAAWLLGSGLLGLVGMARRKLA